jgi:hypothetical protein
MNNPLPAALLPAAKAWIPAPAAPAPRAADPDLARFVEQVDRNIGTDPPDSFWALEEDFRRLQHSGFLGALFNQQLRRIVGQPSHMGDWRPNQAMVHRGRGYAVSVWLFDKPRRYIHSTPFYGMYAPLGSESLYYDVYRLPAGYRNDVFDPALKLEPAGSGMTAPGGILLLQSDRYVYDFRIERPLPVLKFTSAAFHTLEWLFAKDTLQAFQANDSELISTQLRVTAYVLGRLGHPSSQEALQMLASHPHHAARWAGIQNLGRLDRDAALEKVRQTLDDPHPHLRNAAARTLRRLDLTAQG